jgi:hypothetical protein
MTTQIRGNPSSACPSGAFTRAQDGTLYCQGGNQDESLQTLLKIMIPFGVVMGLTVCTVFLCCCWPRLFPRRMRIVPTDQTPESSPSQPAAPSGRIRRGALIDAFPVSVARGTSPDNTSSSPLETDKPEASPAAV